MTCANCGDAIDSSTNTYYDAVTPVEGGGKATQRFCSVKCLNEDVGFSDDEIESLMRQAGYEVPPDYDFEWAAHVKSNIDDLVMQNSGDEGEFFILLEHAEKDYDVEMYHDPEEKLFEVVLYTYDVVEGEKVGLEDVEKQYTAVFQRALARAENFMEKVEEDEV